MTVLKEIVYGAPIQVQLTRLDEGVHVLITGGCRTHVGAVSAAAPGESPQTMAFPGHKDDLISEPWAAALADRIGARAVVACGIHYDDATREQIAYIMKTVDGMLRTILESL